MDQQTAQAALAFFYRATHHIDGREIPALVAVYNALYAAANPRPQATQDSALMGDQAGESLK